MKLNTKMILITLTGFTTILTLSLIGTLLYYNTIKQDQIKKAVADARQNFEVAMIAKKKVWLTNALQVANNSEVREAVLNNDRKQADSVLKQLGKVFKENSGFKNVQVHLVDQELNSFYKSWKPDKFGEKLDYSKGYSLVKETKKSFTAMEMSSKGIRLKGLFPILDKNKFIGIANFEGGLNSIKRTLKPYHVEFIYFMDDAFLNIAKGMKNKHRLGNYILNQKDVDKDFFEHVQKEGLFKQLLASEYLLDDRYLSFKGHFKGFADSKAGLYLLGIKTDIVMESIHALRSLLFELFCLLYASFLTLIIVLIFFINKNIIKPIKMVAYGMEDIATDDVDLTQRIEVKSKDEIGELTTWFNAFVERLENIVVDIGANARTVTASSEEMLSVSEQMSDGTNELSGMANTVATATEEMSSNMDSVAAASEQASTNISMVTESASQMQITLGEIAVNCEKASMISGNAATQVGNASHRVELLGNAAHEISKVTEVITEIAEQINLLALNATIEAARAGEAGKGFAVVAEEIKSLAVQTAQATKDIKEKITGIRSSTDNTVQDVSKISVVISDVNEIVTTIAAAIEEQSASATEVAQNIEQASVGIGEVNENVVQSSQVSTEIAKDISGVNSVTDDISEKSKHMYQSAMNLTDLSLKLKNMISIFKVSQ